MKLVSVGRKDPQLGCILGSEVLIFSLSGLAEQVPSTMMALLSGGAAALGHLSGLVADLAADEAGLARERTSHALLPIEKVELDAPVRPGLILCHGRAYASHREEMGIGHLPRGEPGGFIKNSNAVTGTETPILIPPVAPDMVDFEGELAVVFHSECHRVPVEDAWNYVAGFTLGNDVSARNWVALLLKTTNGAKNTRGKQFPTFFPLGPCIATVDEFANLNSIETTTKVNGEVMQAATTDDLIWPASELISHYSQFYLFKPGDVLTFGSPAGVGYSRSPPVFLKDGDVVEVISPGIGTLRNTVKSVDPAAPPLGIVGQEEH